jgi:hypothetical protein
MLVMLHSSSATYEVISSLFCLPVEQSFSVPLSIQFLCVLWLNSVLFVNFYCESSAVTVVNMPLGISMQCFTNISMCNRLVKRPYHFHNSSVILQMSPTSFSFRPALPPSLPRFRPALLLISICPSFLSPHLFSVHHFCVQDVQQQGVLCVCVCVCKCLSVIVKPR